MSQEDFEKFRLVVLENLSLQRHLREFGEREEFIRRTIEAGAECGFDFTTEDVQNAMRAARRDWIERWI
jgi:hypothetical protein